MLLLQNIFDLVTNKRTQDEDDQKEDYPDEKTGCAEPDIKTHTPRENILRSKHEDDPQDDTGNDTIFQEAVIVFFSLMKKTKGDTQDKVQQFKPHTDTLGYRQYCSPSAKRFPEIERRIGCDCVGLMLREGSYI